MHRPATIGIDIGGTKLLCALFDERFQVVAHINDGTAAAEGEARFMEKLRGHLDALAKRAGKEGQDVVAVGLGSAGVVDRTAGIVRECLSIPFLEQYPLRNRVAALATAHVSIANDVAAGLYGEQQIGAAIGCRHALAFFFGTGIGGAIMIDGELYEGALGRAGDIGHYILHAMGPGRQDTLDNAASRTAIAAEAAALAAKQQAPRLLESVGTDVQAIKGRDLAHAIENGDSAIEEIVRSRLRLAGTAISNLVDFINPEIVVLGGGLVEALPQIALHEISEAVQAHCVAEVARTTRIVKASLGDYAVAAGAAMLALDSLRRESTEQAALAR
jgi:glucokinase